MSRAIAALFFAVCLLPAFDRLAAEEADSSVKAGDFVQVEQLGSGMWKIYVLPKDGKKPPHSVYKVKVFNDRGFFLIAVQKDSLQKRYEVMIPWHAVSRISRETDEEVDVAEKG